MKELTFEKRIEQVTGKATKLMSMIHQLKNGEDISVTQLDDMVFGILKDETELISIIESNKVNQPQMIQLPIAYKKGA
jgi:hypothetical protein